MAPGGFNSYFWIGFYTTTLTYGGLIAVWLRNLAALWNSQGVDFGDNRILLNGKDWTRTALSTFTLASAAVTTAYFVLYNIFFHKNARQEGVPTTEAILERSNSFSMLVLGNLIAGVFALLRCNQLWPKSQKLARASMALIAGSVITALGAIITATDLHPDHWAKPLGFLWIYVFIALTINALVSVIIFHSAIRSSHPNLGLVGTIIESCIMTAVTVLAIVIFYRAEYELLLIFVPVCGMVQAANSALIVSRIVEGKAFSPKMFENSIYLSGQEDSPGPSRRGHGGL